MRLSEIGFGCGPTAGLMVSGDSATQREAVARALDLGVTYFDTAPVYGDGRSEEALGRALKSLKARATIATKVALEVEDLADIPGAVRRSVDQSLQRLLADRLDIVHIHNRVGARRAPKAAYGSGALLSVDDVLGEGGVMRALRECQEAGKVGAIGCCGYGGELGALETVVDQGGFSSILVNYSLLNTSAWDAVETARNYCRIGARAAARGMGVIALRALEAGLLTRTELLEPGQPHAPLKFLHEQEGGLIGAAIRFALSNDDVSSVLIGFSALEQIEHAATCAERGPLDPDTLARLATVTPSLAKRPAG